MLNPNYLKGSTKSSKQYQNFDSFNNVPPVAEIDLSVPLQITGMIFFVVRL